MQIYMQFIYMYTLYVQKHRLYRMYRTKKHESLEKYLSNGVIKVHI